MFSIAAHMGLTLITGERSLNIDWKKTPWRKDMRGSLVGEKCGLWYTKEAMGRIYIMMHKSSVKLLLK
ncbi:hypothetical protein PIB30_039798 [Stylosanthes scabra]|uniref:Uncharacterized protein n=1 Tax=Stylosanthes scabra TaxID=79078 RepID=A0ABU6YDE0_9FABA|nr:hypothetical protein [Stylosanthes scabra]